MKLSSFPVLLLVVLLSAYLAGCHTAGIPREYLMPAPVTVTEGVADPEMVRKVLADNNNVDIFYATNRKPSQNDSDRHYVTDYDQVLRLGTARIRIGGKSMSSEEIFNQAISAKRSKEIPLLLEKVTQQATVPTDQSLKSLSDETNAYLNSINEALAKNKDKDITVYVHGANNTFYRSASQAAQFRYFTGSQSIVILYSWPSAGSLMRYGVDVENSAQSFSVFTRLLELLSRHTDARRINVLAYSAGARIASPGLSLLAQQLDQSVAGTPGKKFPLGMVYYAEPDEDQLDFMNNLVNYLHLADGVTVTVNFHDSVLAYAETYSGKAKIGMPDASQISAEKVNTLIKKLQQPNMHVIDIDGSRIPGLARGEHGAWYNHPWINTDVIVQFLYHAPPAERGLVIKEIHNRPWKTYWIYPEDYPVRIRGLAPGIKARYGSKD